MYKNSLALSFGTWRGKNSYTSVVVEYTRAAAAAASHSWGGRESIFPRGMNTNTHERAERSEEKMMAMRRVNTNTEAEQQQQQRESVPGAVA
jgi:hypothetical protein